MSEKQRQLSLELDNFSVHEMKTLTFHKDSIPKISDNPLPYITTNNIHDVVAYRKLRRFRAASQKKGQSYIIIRQISIAKSI